MIRDIKGTHYSARIGLLLKSISGHIKYEFARHVYVWQMNMEGWVTLEDYPAMSIQVPIIFENLMYQTVVKYWRFCAHYREITLLQQFKKIW